MTTKEIIDALREGAASDIWYDALDHNDEAAANRISNTQLAMHEAADMIEAMCQLVGLIQ